MTTTYRETKRAELLASKPKVAYESGPVFDWDSDKYHPDLQTFLDYMADDEIVPSSRLVFPCTVGKAHTVDLAEQVSEGWAEQYDDDGWEVAGNLPDAVKEALAHAQKVCEEHAPTVWEVDFRSVLDLQQFDGDR